MADMLVMERRFYGDNRSGQAEATARFAQAVEKIRAKFSKAWKIARAAYTPARS
jgi:hypothetical protein